MRNIEGAAPGPSKRDISRFNKACREWVDPNNDQQFSTWALAAQVLSDKGWKPELVIRTLWFFQPGFQSPGMTAERVVEIIAGERQRNQYPHRLHPMEERCLQAIEEYAAVTGMQIVIRDRDLRDPSNLPPGIRFPGPLSRLRLWSGNTRSWDGPRRGW